MPDDKPRVVLLGPEDSAANALRVLAEAGVAPESVIVGEEADAWVLEHGERLSPATVATFPGGPEGLRQMMEDARELGSSLERMERATTPPWTHGDPAGLLYRKPKRSPDDTRDRKARRKRQSKARRKNRK